MSDFCYLPRIWLAYQRAGLDVATVPSQARRIPRITGLAIREIPVFWVYYLRAIRWRPREIGLAGADWRRGKGQIRAGFEHQVTVRDAAPVPGRPWLR